MLGRKISDIWKISESPQNTGSVFYFYNGTWFGDVLRGPGCDPGAVVEVGASGEIVNIGDQNNRLLVGQYVAVFDETSTDR